MPLLLRIEDPPDPDRPDAPGHDLGSSRLVEVDTVLRIGRAEDNDLVLPDPDRVLSKQHCVVRLDAGRYVVLDGSANGTFLNDGAKRLERGQPVPLAAGDAIRLGAFTLTVVSVILPDAGRAETGADPLGPVSNAPPPPAAPRHAAAARDIDAFLDSMNGLPGGGAEDFLEAPSPEPWPAAPMPVAADPDHVPPVQESFSRPRPHKEAIPDDWDPLAEIGGLRLEVRGQGNKDAPPPLAGLGREADPGWGKGAGHENPPHTPPPPTLGPLRGPSPQGEGEPFSHIPADPDPYTHGTPPTPDHPQPAGPDARHEPTPEPSRSRQSPNAAPAPPSTPQPTPTAGNRRPIDLLLTACGLNPATLTDAKAAAAAERAGHVMRIAIDGMLQILGSRGVAKQEFGMQRTAISRGANNAMKFVATAEEALQMLLCNDIPGFLPPEDAMRETVRDIQSHHFALLSGVRAALADTLRRLDPAAIEQALPHRAADPMLPALRKARAWDAFRAKYAELERSLAGDGHDVFGSEFARAYAAIQNAPTQPRSAAAEAQGDAV